MSRILVINENNISIYVDKEYECLYKTNGVCFNNKSKWLGKKCYLNLEKCTDFEEEIMRFREESEQEE